MRKKLTLEENDAAQSDYDEKESHAETGKFEWLGIEERDNFGLTLLGFSTHSTPPNLVSL